MSWVQDQPEEFELECVWRTANIVHVLCVRDVMWYTGCVWWKVQEAPRDGSQAGNVELVGHKGAGKCGEEHLYAKRNVL